MRLSFLSDRDTIAALRDSLVSGGMLTDVEEAPGTRAEIERLGFELGDVMTLIGIVGGAVEAIALVKAALGALAKSGAKRIEISGPTGRATIDVDGKTPEEVEEAVRKALPFLN